jgi:regulator of protease activity HflC (stomatin/prohibitin superfamily)
LKVDVKQPGLFFAIPGIDRIAYCVDMRETAIVIPPQTTITKDNVSVRWW